MQLLDLLSSIDGLPLHLLSTDDSVYLVVSNPTIELIEFFLQFLSTSFAIEEPDLFVRGFRRAAALGVGLLLLLLLACRFFGRSRPAHIRWLLGICWWPGVRWLLWLQWLLQVRGLLRLPWLRVRCPPHTVKPSDHGVISRIDIPARWGHTTHATI